MHKTHFSVFISVMEDCKLKKKCFSSILLASLALGENSLYAPVYRDRFSQGRLSECSITFNVQRIGFWTIFLKKKEISYFAQ